MKGADTPSIEGVLLNVWKGHYQLANARHIVSQDDSFELTGEAWVPAENVLYVQVIG